MKKEKRIDMEKILSNPRFRGKHVIVVAGKVFTAKTGEKASKILAEVRRKYPKETPAITYIPDADALILFCAKRKTRFSDECRRFLWL